jgi:hypothetical protein
MATDLRLGTNAEGGQEVGGPDVALPRRGEGPATVPPSKPAEHGGWGDGY